MIEMYRLNFKDSQLQFASKVKKNWIFQSASKKNAVFKNANLTQVWIFLKIIK